MAITLVGSGTVGTAINGGTVTLTFPTTTAANDIVFVVGGHFFRASTSVGPTVASSYTTIIAATDATSSDSQFGVWARRLAAAEATVACQGGGNANDGVMYGAFVLRGCSTLFLTDSSIATNAAVVNSTAADPDPPAVTTLTSDAWILALTGVQAADSNVTVPSGYSNLFGSSQFANDTTDAKATGATRQATVAGVVDPGAYTGYALVGMGRAFTVAVRTAGSSPAGPAMSLAPYKWPMNNLVIRSIMFSEMPYDSRSDIHCSI